ETGVVTSDLWTVVAGMAVPQSLSGAVLAAARVDLIAGGREDLGHNDGHRIREYAARVKGAVPANWWALALSAWLLAGAAALGIEAPIAGSAGAQTVMGQFKAADRWFSAAELRADPTLVKPGMVPVWDRSDPAKPETAWWGHIGIV